MSKHKPWTDSLALDGSSSGRIRAHLEGDGSTWYEGCAVTVYGIVAVYSDDYYTRYDFVRDGRMYCHYEYVSRRPRGLTIKATRFAREISERRVSRSSTRREP